jgi:hypothetical protein
MNAGMSARPALLDAGVLGGGMKCRGCDRARTNSRCRSGRAIPRYRMVTVGELCPSSFITPGKVTPERLRECGFWRG